MVYKTVHFQQTQMSMWLNFTVNDDYDDDDDDDGSDSYGDNFTCRKHFLLYLCHLMFLILTLGVLSF